jgi:hypothetical protein
MQQLINTVLLQINISKGFLEPIEIVFESVAEQHIQSLLAGPALGPGK